MQKAIAILEKRQNSNLMTNLTIMGNTWLVNLLELLKKIANMINLKFNKLSS